MVCCSGAAHCYHNWCYAQVKGAHGVIHESTSGHKCLLQLVSLLTVHSSLNMVMKTRKSEIIFCSLYTTDSLVFLFLSMYFNILIKGDVS